LAHLGVAALYQPPEVGIRWCFHYVCIHLYFVSSLGVLALGVMHIHYCHFIVITVLSLAILCAHSAFSKQISVGLDTAHLAWADDEVIGSGHIIIHGGAISAYHQVGALIGLMKNDPKTATGSLALLFVQPSGWPPDKESETYSIDKWFEVVPAETSATKQCPSAGCPIEIEGELTFERFPPDSSEPRKVHVTTSDFVLTEKPAASRTGMKSTEPGKPSK
jgi:hypothetical protein